RIAAGALQEFRGVAGLIQRRGRRLAVVSLPRTRPGWKQLALDPQAERLSELRSLALVDRRSATPGVDARPERAPFGVADDRSRERETPASRLVGPRRRRIYREVFVPGRRGAVDERQVFERERTVEQRFGKIWPKLPRALR